MLGNLWYAINSVIYVSCVYSIPWLKHVKTNSYYNFVFILKIRLPTDVNDDVDEDPTGTKALWDRGLLNGATQKVENSVNFHIGEVITSLQKTTLIPGGSESLVYTTLSGGIGMLVPFASNEV